MAVQSRSAPPPRRLRPGDPDAAGFEGARGDCGLETAPAPVDCIAPIADALRDKLEIICDGGVRRGTHVIKALALGANACSIGRGYLFGLAAGGQKGVERALHLLKSEFERSMALLGCNSVHKLGRHYLNKR